MSDQTSVGKQSSDDLEQQVVDYLSTNPDFFKHHSDLLAQLYVPHQQGGGTISLVERQTALLREQNRELKGQLNDLIEAARYNDLQFEKVRRLVINLLEAHNLSEAEVAIEEGLCQEFNGDAVELLVLTNGTNLSANHLRRISPEDCSDKITQLINGDWAVCGSLDDEVCEFVFPGQADKILSAALVPLNKGPVQGLLAIGSHQANYFHSSMGTLFLNYIGEVLSRVLYRFSTEPDQQA